MRPLSTAYNMLFQLKLPFRADARFLQEALNDLTARHEVLRTCFEHREGEVWQIVAARREVRLQVHNSEDGGESPNGEFAAALADSVARPFDLSQSPLLRVHLGLQEKNNSRLGMVLHHAIADGQSLNVLVGDLQAFYGARLSGRPVFLPELPVQYADFSNWQKQSLTGKRLEKLSSYWRNRLNGLSELALIHDRPRPIATDGRGRVHSFQIPAALLARLRALSADCGATLFCAMIAAFAVTLSRFSGQASITMGTPVSGRSRPELDRVVGLFVNSLVFHADLSDNPTFVELLRRLSRLWAEDLSHQDMPFDLLVDALQAKRHSDRNPIFQVMFQLQVGQRTEAGETTTPLAPETVASQLDLSVIQYETAGGDIQGGVVYASEIFEGGTIRQIVDTYLAVLEDGSRQPADRVLELPVIGPDRSCSSVSEGERHDWPEPFLLHQWFRMQAAHGAEPAVVSDDECLSFQDLDARSDALAAHLRMFGVGRGRVVAICMSRSVDTIATIVAVLKAGGAYLCLDRNAPAKWREFVIADCDVHVVVGVRGGEDLAFGRPFLPVESMRTALGAGHRTVCENIAPDEPAYVIYTSGSTGQPKGVVIPHRAIVNHMRWMLERFPIGAGDRVLQRTPLTFDASVWEVHAPLLSGATLVLAPEGKLFDPGQLLERIAQQRITTLQVVPSLLRALLRHGGLAASTRLKRVFCGGEALTPDLRDEFFRACPAELVNLYGPTEATIDATYHVCDRNDRRPFVPIGRPVANVAAYVLDERQSVLPAGAAGELYLGGSAVGTGYHNRPQLTAEKFLQIPSVPAEKLYRTGDRVRLLAGGELQFLGRLDNQIKLRGFRIELGEIEAVLALHPAVREAAVVLQEFKVGDQRLVAFVSTSGAESLDLRLELFARLRDRLPEHCVPSSIVLRAALPKTVHGKIDRAALARTRAAEAAVSSARPRTALEAEVCGVFEDVLQARPVGIDDNFFHLGGHSLLVISLQQKLFQLLEREISVIDVFEYPTPRELVRLLDRMAGKHHSAEERKMNLVGGAGGGPILPRAGEVGGDV
jgi:amino acid adenylation domain-containing protein